MVDVVVASDRWESVGRELAKLDPRRFLALLEIAETLVQIHTGLAPPILLLLTAPDDEKMH
jgi:hypothetical protein